MSGKTKLFLLGMAFLAIVSAQQIYGSVKASREVAAFLPSTFKHEKLPEQDPDFDDDGLSNSEESYWNTDIDNPDTDGDGFKDGEETTSGHNPLVPGPNDFQDTRKNLSQRTNELLFSGLAFGDLLPNSPKFDESVDKVTLSVVHDFYDSQPGIPAVPIITAGSDIENQKAYLEYLSSVIKSYLIDFRFFPSLTVDMISDRDSTLKVRDQMIKAYDALATIPVPNNWKDAHMQVLDMLQRLQVNYKYFSEYETDPIRAFLAAKEIAYILDVESKTFMKDLNNRIKEEKIPLSDGFFTVLGLLYKQ